MKKTFAVSLSAILFYFLFSSTTVSIELTLNNAPI
jgi:hypothetical protein